MSAPLDEPHARLEALRRKMRRQLWLLAVLSAGFVLAFFYLRSSDVPVDRTDFRRDLRLPSTRLVGHWEFFSEVEGDKTHHYFTAVDPNGYGKYTLVTPEGVTREWRYKITMETPKGWNMTIACYSGDQVRRVVNLSIPEHGRHASYEFEFFNKMQKRTMNYVGPETVPPGAR